ncbi:hypothetical protein ABKA04_007708 [Annulohypoxylon sp. FPYF3050]
MNTYQYKKLNTDKEEIRLVHLFPGTFDDEIAFTISHVPLPPRQAPLSKRLPMSKIAKTVPKDWIAFETREERYLFAQTVDPWQTTWDHPDPTFDRTLYEPPENASMPYQPSYEALSYTWGSQSNTVKARVLVPGPSGSFPCQFYLGANLASALRHLRDRESSRCLWIDAICINQEDVSERNAQVRRMRLIYSLAERVVMWIGEETYESKLALETLTYIGSQIEADASLSLIAHAPNAKDTEMHDPTYVPSYIPETWVAISSLFARPWFSRAWVLQEHQLSSAQSIMQCGTVTCLFNPIRRAILTLSLKQKLPQNLFLRLNAFSRPLGTPGKQNFARLLLFARSIDCTDPRDRVYAILGLAPQPVVERIHPMYSLSTREVYEDAFLGYYEVTGRLDLLLQCDGDIDSDLWPSWLPKWSKRGTWIGLPTSKEMRTASGPSQAWVEIKKQPFEFLEVLGLYSTDAVRHLVPVQSEALQHSYQETLQKFARSQEAEAGGGADSVINAVLEALCLGMTDERYPDEVRPSLTELREEFDRGLTNGPDAPIMRKTIVADIGDNSTLFMTGSGHVGIASSRVQEG